MKGSLLWFLPVALSFCFAIALPAQQPEGLANGSLQEQYDYLFSNSSRYQNYKVVPQPWLNAFWGNVRDSLQNRDGLLLQCQNTIKVQDRKVKELEVKIDSLLERIIILEEEKDSLSFLGITFHKTVYHTLVWIIIGALAVGLLFFLGRFRFAYIATRKMRKDNGELQEKVEQLRKRMLEKEQELGRQLQDEINKRLGHS